MIISHSVWKEMEILFSQCTSFNGKIFYNCVHTEKSFRNLIKLTRNQIVFTIFRLILVYLISFRKKFSMCRRRSLSVMQTWLRSPPFLKPVKHHDDMVSRILKRTLYWALIMPRGVSGKFQEWLYIRKMILTSCYFFTSCQIERPHIPFSPARGINISFIYSFLKNLILHLYLLPYSWYLSLWYIDCNFM